jgi:hypothetical protein
MPAMSANDTKNSTRATSTGERPWWDPPFLTLLPFLPADWAMIQKLRWNLILFNIF